MQKRNILITGGAGFIGSHLVDRLAAEKKWEIVAVDDFNDFYSPEIKFENVRRHLEDKNYKLIKADICDREKIHSIFERFDFDTVVHLAARAGVRPSLKEPELYARTNISGTLVLLENARRFGVKQFVFGSSSSVYGVNANVPFAEDAPVCQPVSPYAATKAAGELLCHTYAHLYQIRCLCLRFFTVYGARQRPDLAIHKFVELISKNKTIQLFGNGNTRRDYTYIDDIIDGLRAAIDYRKSFYEIINLGESRTVRLLELVSIIEKILGKKADIDYLPEQPGDVPQTFADISKAGRLLGYFPQTDIETGVGKFIEWYKDKSGREEKLYARHTASAAKKAGVQK